MKMYFISVIALSLMVTACNNEAKTKVTDVTKTIDVLYSFTETSDSNFCNADSIIPGDCGIGELYLARNGSALYNSFCMGQDTAVYDIGSYVVSDTTIVCSFNKAYKYYECSDCVGEEQTKSVDPNSGKIEVSAPWTLTLRKTNCNNFEYAVQPSAEELEWEQKAQEKAKKEKYELAHFRGYVFYKADTARTASFFGDVAKIKALNSFARVSQK